MFFILNLFLENASFFDNFFQKSLFFTQITRDFIGIVQVYFSNFLVGFHIDMGP